jgi:hypothetical protein
MYSVHRCASYIARYGYPEVPTTAASVDVLLRTEYGGNRNLRVILKCVISFA